MTTQASKFDIGRWAQVILLIVTIAAVFIKGGQILEHQQSLETLLAEKEKNRDERFSALQKQIEGEIEARKATDQKLDRLRDLFLIRFGQTVTDDPFKRSKQQ